MWVSSRRREEWRKKDLKKISLLFFLFSFFSFYSFPLSQTLLLYSYSQEPTYFTKSSPLLLLFLLIIENLFTQLSMKCHCSLINLYPFERWDEHVVFLDTREGSLGWKESESGRLWYTRAFEGGGGEEEREEERRMSSEEKYGIEWIWNKTIQRFFFWGICSSISILPHHILLSFPSFPSSFLIS